MAAVLLGVFISYTAILLLVFYGFINVGYSIWWKHIVIIDVFIISLGFMLRILVGTSGIDISPSSWLLLCGLTLTLFLGFAKRRAELMTLEEKTIPDKTAMRRVLDDYNPQLIEQFMSISAACAILSYALYTVAPETIAIHHTRWLIVTVPLVIYGVFRYLYLLHQEGRGQDATRDLYADWHLLVTLAVWAALVIAVLV